MTVSAKREASAQARGLDPQLAALCTLLRPALALEPQAGAAAMADAALVQFAVARHRVGPLLAHALALAGVEPVGSDASGMLAADCARSARGAAQRQLAEMRARALLDRAGVGVVGIKGPALAAALYGDAALRPSRDIDLLIAPRDARTALAALQAGGLRHVAHALAPQADAPSRPEGSLRRRVLEMRVFKDVELHDDPLDATLELHGRLFAVEPHGFSERLRGENAELADASLTSDHYVLYLVLHGAVSFWPRLRWLADFAMLAGRIAPERRARIVALAQDYGAGPALAASCGLCEQCFPGSIGPGWPLPEAGGHGVAHDLVARFLRQLTDHAPGAVHRPPTLSPLENPLLMVFGRRVSLAQIAGQRIAKSLMLRI